jgi:hypothetical protein
MGCRLAYACRSQRARSERDRVVGVAFQRDRMPCMYGVRVLMLSARIQDVAEKVLRGAWHAWSECVRSPLISVSNLAILDRLAIIRSRFSRAGE